MMSRNSDKYAQYRDVLEHYESCLDHGEIDIDCFDNKFCEVIDMIRADAIEEFAEKLKPIVTKWFTYGCMYLGDIDILAEQMKEQKLCSNGQPCTHPKCNKCGTTHFMSECDYGKE